MKNKISKSLEAPDTKAFKIIINKPATNAEKLQMLGAHLGFQTHRPLFWALWFVVLPAIGFSNNFATGFIAAFDYDPTEDLNEQAAAELADFDEVAARCERA
jgi:hypothetical protein